MINRTDCFKCITVNITWGDYLKILVVQESDWLTRGPHQQHHLVERLMQRGHEIRVIDFQIDWRMGKGNSILFRRRVFDAPGKVVRRQTTTVIRPTMFRVPLISYLSILLFHLVELTRQMRSYGPDVVIGFGIVNAYIAAKISRFHGIPFVYYLIDSLHTLIPERHLRPIGKAIEKATLEYADRVYVINKHLGRYAKKLAPFCRPKVISAGIDKSLFSPNSDGTNMRERLGIPKDELVLFFMGWLYEFSGLREVAASVVEKQVGVRLVVLGRGDLYDELMKLAGQAAFKNKIQVFNWVPYEEVPKYISAADVCILPAQLNEIMRNIVPIKIYEYLACGKPVVATRLPGIVHEFGYESGVVYVSRPQDVAGQAINICKNRRLYSKMRNAALRFSDPLDWESITDDFESDLENFVSSWS